MDKPTQISMLAAGPASAGRRQALDKRTQSLTEPPCARVARRAALPIERLLPDSDEAGPIVGMGAGRIPEHRELCLAQRL